MRVPRLPAELLIAPAVRRVRDGRCTARTMEETKIRQSTRVIRLIGLGLSNSTANSMRAAAGQCTDCLSEGCLISGPLAET